MSSPTDTMPPGPIRTPGRLELAHLPCTQVPGGPLGLATAGAPAAQGERRAYRARLITAGTIRAQGNHPSNLEIPASTLQTALDAHLFDGRPAFVDHPSWLDDYPSLRNLAGLVTDCAWDATGAGIVGTITLYPTDAGRVVADLFDQVLADAGAGRPAPDIGLSAVLWCRWELTELDESTGRDVWQMAEIRHVESVDFVFEPGADGRVQAALTALRALPALGVTVPAAEGAPGLNSPAALGVTGGQVLEAGSPNGPIRPDLGSAALGMTGCTISDPEIPNPVGAALAAAQHPVRTADTAAHALERSDPPMPEQPNTQSPSAASGSPTPAPTPAPDVTEWLTSLRLATADALIAASGLPAIARDRIHANALSGALATPADVENAIAAEREYLASLVSDQVVQVGGTPPRGSSISLGRTSTEQVEAALEALIAGRRPPAGVQPLTGIRELYHLLSGDYDMHGVFQAERVPLANVTSSTMAGLVANALNKAVVNTWQEYPRWWEPAVTMVDFATLQDTRWITLGGVGELPTVAEGAAYTELTWDDQTETEAFTKKGGYLGITLEAIDKDDTGRLQAAPRALARAAWLTLGKSVAAIFTTASALGPTMSDAGTLFNATAVSSAGGHANLLTAALSWSSWQAVKVAMMKQPELNSAERLGALTRPKFLWVPIDLETTALQILASEGEPGTADNDVNPEAAGNERDTRLAEARRRVIVCPLWTDTNNWAAQADPNLYPSIGLGFRYGRTPEIFSVASPTAGLMFTNDTLPVKVRFFFAVGPTDWRGLHKNNVA